MNKLLLILIFFVSAGAYAQTEKKMAASGTYQLIRTVVPKIPEELFTTELLYTIESSREENEEKILQIGQYTSVRILSRKAISAPGFVPLKDEVIYKEAIDPQEKK